MVINKNSMGYGLNKKMRKKMIYVYEEYLKNPRDKFIQDGSSEFDMEYNQLYSKVMGLALDNSWGIYEGTLSVKKAKEILKALKKEEEEDSTSV